MLDTSRSLSEIERRALLMEASERSILYLAPVKARPVACSAAALVRLATLRERLPEGAMAKAVRHTFAEVRSATVRPSRMPAALRV